MLPCLCSCPCPQRLVMECFSEAYSSHQAGLAASGSADAAASRGTGVYVGVSQLEYARISYEAGAALSNTYYATGAHLSVASGGWATLPGRRACTASGRRVHAWLALACFARFTPYAWHELCP